MNDQDQVKAAPKQQFDPSVQYAWKPKDVFLLNGAELQFLYNVLSEKLDNPEAIRIVKDYQCLQIVQNLLAKAVQDGIAVPAENIPREVPQFNKTV